MRGKPEGGGFPIDEFLPELREMGLAYVRRHLPDRPAEHEDLVHEALLGVSEWTRGMPRVSREDARRVTMAILKRRVADLFRDQTRRWAQQDDERAAATTLDPREVLISRAVRATVGFLADASKEDRMLVSLLLADGVRAEARPLTDAERKRLERLRHRLRAHLLETLGDSLSEILKHEPE